MAVRTIHEIAAVAVIAVGMAAFAVDVAAQPAGPDPELVAQRIEQAKARLNLTPEQEAQLRPAMEERARRMKEIRDKHAGDTSHKARREMLREARPVQEEYEAKVKAILTEPQFEEWEQMRKEARQQMREQYGNKRGSE